MYQVEAKLTANRNKYEMRKHKIECLIKKYTALNLPHYFCVGSDFFAILRDYRMWSV